MLRIGQGWDIHRLVEGRPLILGGIEIPSEKGEEAHSDGDVLIHAIIDALLGALALGDIGTHFPPSDVQWKDADSKDLLRAVMALVDSSGYRPVNLDTSIILEQPKLKNWKETIKKSLAQLLAMEENIVSVKAKTSEKVGPTGRGESIEAQAVILLQKQV